MLHEELFANAKNDVFGAPPDCHKALIGYKMAINYFECLVKEAEPVLQQIEAPRHTLSLYLKNSFRFSDYAALRNFPPETIAAIEEAANNFRVRYEPLLRKHKVAW